MIATRPLTPDEIQLMRDNFRELSRMKSERALRKRSVIEKTEDKKNLDDSDVPDTLLFTAIMAIVAAIVVIFPFIMCLLTKK